MKNLTNWILAFVLWAGIVVMLVIAITKPVYAIPLEINYVEGSHSLSREEVIKVIKLAASEWSESMSRPLRVVRLRSLNLRRFKSPVMGPDWMDYIHNYRRYVKRNTRRGVKRAFLLFAPTMQQGKLNFFGGLAFQGYYKKFPQEAVAVVYGKRLSDDGENRLRVCSKLAQHELAHLICNLGHSYINTGDNGYMIARTECMMTPYLKLNVMPHWCATEIEVCENRFKSWRWMK